MQIYVDFEQPKPKLPSSKFILFVIIAIITITFIFMKLARAEIQPKEDLYRPTKTSCTNPDVKSGHITSPHSPIKTKGNLPLADYTNEEIADAIYKVEGGKKAKVPYGILSVKVNSEAEARQICINTIRNNKIRFAKQNKYSDFIEFLGSRYCPVSAHKLNRYWVRNVKFWLAKQK